MKRMNIEQAEVVRILHASTILELDPAQCRVRIRPADAMPPADAMRPAAAAAVTAAAVTATAEEATSAPTPAPASASGRPVAKRRQQGAKQKPKQASPLDAAKAQLESLLASVAPPGS